MKRSFSRAIIHNKVLSRDKEDLLVVFMLCNVKEIFKVKEITKRKQVQICASLV